MALVAATILLAVEAGLSYAEGFVSAGVSGPAGRINESRAAAKLAHGWNEGTQGAVVLFARFRREVSGDASTPVGFLLAGATGINNLGLTSAFVTDDPTITGEPAVVATGHGTVQRGGPFTETAGVICHEFGHLLGLPDLYDTGFVHEEEPTPDKDSAGIGAWSLMDWGATGWNGDDGPDSLCAWNRRREGSYTTAMFPVPVC